MRAPPEPVHVVRSRRDAALERLAGSVPYARFLGIRFDRRGDELTAILPFRDGLIGNPVLPALHGGATASLLELAAQVELAWGALWHAVEGGTPVDEAPIRLPRTIDFTVDYLRPGLPRDAYARARVTRAGRRYASVQVEAWQDHRDRPFIAAAGHFLMPGA